MIERVEIFNYRTIQHLRLDLLPSSVLVGDTGVGKSNVIRALHDALYGTVGADHVRHGVKGQARVELTVRDPDSDAPPLVYTWRKGEGRELLHIGHEAVTRDTWERRLRVEPLRLEGFEASLNHADQVEPIFLLNQSAGTVAKVLGAMSGLHHCYEAQRALQTEVQQLQRNLKVKEAEVQAAEQQVDQAVAEKVRLEALLGPLRLAVQQAEAMGRVVGALRHHATQLVDAELRLGGSRARLDGLQWVPQAGEALEAARPLLERAAALRLNTEALAHAQGKGRTLHSRLGGLTWVEGARAMLPLLQAHTENAAVLAETARRLHQREIEEAALEGLLEATAGKIGELEAQLEGIDTCPLCGTVGVTL